MRSTRRSTDDGSSLDMLLDAITNSFGTIMLIAITVVLLVNSKSENDSPETVDAQEQVDVETLQVELAAVQRLLQSTQEDYERYFDPELQAKIDDFHETRHQNTQAGETIEKREQEIARLHELTCQLGDEVESLENRRNQLAADVDETQSAIDQWKEEKSIYLPIKRELDALSPVLLIMKEGRLAVYLQEGEFNLQVLDRVDDGDFDIVDETAASLVHYRFRNNAGIEVNNSAALKTLLGRLASRTHGLQIAVYPDDFDEFFHSVMPELLDRRLSYIPLPMLADSPIKIRNSNKMEFQ